MITDNKIANSLFQQETQKRLFLDFNTFALILCYYIDLLDACCSCCSVLDFLGSVIIGVLR